MQLQGGSEDFNHRSRVFREIISLNSKRGHPHNTLELLRWCLNTVVFICIISSALSGHSIRCYVYAIPIVSLVLQCYSVLTQCHLWQQRMWIRKMWIEAEMMSSKRHREKVSREVGRNRRSSFIVQTNTWRNTSRLSKCVKYRPFVNDLIPATSSFCSRNRSFSGLVACVLTWMYRSGFNITTEGFS